MKSNNIVFLFDLDGTITAKESLPIISNYFHINEEIEELTKETISGNIPFLESFIKRVNILGKLPISEIDQLLSDIPLSKGIVQFIQEHQKDCVIVTGNFGGWVKGLVKKIGCECFSSDGIIKENKIQKLTYVLKKEDVVKHFASQGKTVVFIGDGNNDTEAMREADISIACGLVHQPARSVLTVADYAIFDEKALCRLLNQIYTEQPGKSLVLSCAGIGSRLGLGQTKALININGKPLIYWQLEMFEMFEDIRIVIGFQANEIIKMVLKKRKNIIFVYNHDYFYTKTGTSYYLGARYGNEYSIAWDGDLLVHPDDIDKCLNYPGEYIGCSDIISDEPVYIKSDENGYALSFSRKFGDFEWSGPACLKKKNIKYVSTNVFNQIEEYLPLPLLKIRAQDIDTYDDYKRAISFMEEWSNSEK